MITFTEFKSNVKEVARPNRFLARIEGIIPTLIGNLPSNYKFVIQKATIPKLDISGPDIKYRGTTIKLRGDYKKDALSMSFWNDTTWKTRTFFENWMHYIVDPSLDNNRRENNKFRLGNSIIVSQFGQAGANDIIAEYEYFDVTPSDISDIPLDHTQENVLEEYSVTFQYSRWERLT